MKIIKLILLINSILLVSLRAQTKTDACQDLIIKGYVVVQYKNTDIQAMKNPTKHMVDIYQRAYFVPIEKNIADQSTIDSINVLDPGRVYFLPSKETDRLLSKYCSNTTVPSNTEPQKNDLSAFFQIGKTQSQFLYKIYYSECRAMKASVPNNSYNAFQLNVPFNKKNATLTCYFIYRDLVLQEIEKIDEASFTRVGK